MYGFTDKILLNALLQKKDQGKTVQVILEKTPYKAENENVRTIQLFNQHQLMWKGEVPPFDLIHQKTLLIDHKQAFVMTFNFTHGTFKNQRNFALILEDPRQVNALRTLFSSDWNQVAYKNTDKNFIISPDGSRQQIQTYIQQAKQSIDIYAQNINDYKIIGALTQAAKKGIRVNIVTSSTMRAKQQAYLQRAGVHIHYSKKLIIHAKVILIDHQLAMLGSINLTRHSLDANRELSVITRDPTVIQALIKTFEQDKHVAPSLNDIDELKKLLPNKRLIKHYLRQLDQYIEKHYHD
jgi:phosphatidylserine/phosphatidylglycerophosphate/cardiolipin synthase-like enzyme